MSISLGSVDLSGFNVTNGVSFGGAQAMVVHQLPGGSRVIDAMGPDDADIRWGGFLTGQAAADNARLLDMMRVSGAQVTLGWDEALYTVVIRTLNFQYHNSWWISYSISCAVVTDPPTLALDQAQSLLTSITSDLSSAGTWVLLDAAQSALAAPGATTPGTQANAAAAAALASASMQTQDGIAAADIAINTVDVLSLVACAGTLAGLVSAQGYLARASVNLSTGST